MQFKPFDNQDWTCFSGTEGDDPLIHWTEGVSSPFVADWIIIDDQGMQAGFSDDKVYDLPIARTVAELMGKSMTVDHLTETGLEAIGFERIN